MMEVAGMGQNGPCRVLVEGVPEEEAEQMSHVVGEGACGVYYGDGGAWLGQRISERGGGGSDVGGGGKGGVVLELAVMSKAYCPQ